MKNSLWLGVAPIVLLGLLLSPASAAVELPALFGDNMVLQSGEPLHFWGWADPGEKITIKQGDVVLASTEGQGKDKPWRVQLPAQKAGLVADIEVIGSNTITLTNILAGEVWLCSGQSNMVKTVQKGTWCWWGGVLDEDKVIASATDNQIRVFREESGPNAQLQSRTKGSWQICSPATVPQFSAVAYFFALKLRAELKAPVGLIVSAVGGTANEPWTPERTLKSDAAFADFQTQTKALLEKLKAEKAEDQKTMSEWKKQAGAAKAKGEQPPPAPALKLTPDQGLVLKDDAPVLTPGILYNGKIHPLAPFNIKGAIWYQGESNARRGEIYAATMTDLIQGWREDWGEPFPFIFVTLAGFGQPEAWSQKQGSYPLIREAQIKVAETVPHCGVISSVDIGEARNIHPRNKQAVGQRAALWALDHVYGQKVVSAGPTFGKIDFEARKAIVHFTGNAKGLTLKSPAGFELAGADRKFISAQAEIKGDTLEITAPGLSQPVALRYAFQNFPECTVYNGAGLPALPFRTDVWPVNPSIVRK